MLEQPEVARAMKQKTDEILVIGGLGALWQLRLSRSTRCQPRASAGGCLRPQGGGWVKESCTTGT